MSENPGPAMNRMAIAVLSLAGFFVAFYMLAFSLGWTGPIICGLGECATVQASRWAKIGPLPVAALGVGGYLTLFALAMAGIQPGWASSRPVGIALLTLSSIALVFSGWLTYLEAFVIHAWCQWCVISAILATLIFLAALPERKRLRGTEDT